MSWAILAAPTIVPLQSRTGEMVSEISSGSTRLVPANRLVAFDALARAQLGEDLLFLVLQILAG